MGSWIRVDVALRDHRKVRKLARLLGIEDRDLVVGKLARLWSAIRSRVPDGNLAGWTCEDIAFEAGLDHLDPARVVAGLLDCGKSPENPDGSGFLERVPGGYVAHDWTEHSGAFLRDAERMRERRASQRLSATPRQASLDLDAEPFANGSRTFANGSGKRSNVRVTGQDMTGQEGESEDAAGAAFDPSTDPGELDPRVADALRRTTSVLRMPARFSGKLDVDPISQIAAPLGPAGVRSAIQCAHAMWKADVRSQALVERVIAYAVGRGDVRNLHAYTNPRAPSFVAMRQAIAGAMSAEEGEAFKAWERRIAASAG